MASTLRKFRFEQPVQIITYVKGRDIDGISEKVIPSGTRGNIRGHINNRGGEHRYHVAFPRSSNSADGIVLYWCDESILEPVDL